MRDDWKEFDLSLFTDFYFNKSGKTLKRIVGWGPTEELFLVEIREAVKLLEE